MPESILIADDEPSFLESTAELLGRDGYACECVRDADQAIEMLRLRRFDLLITDLRMPGNAKMRLIEQSRLLAEGMPVIIITAYPSVQSAVQAISLPVVAYLRKPLDYDQLRERVKQSLQASRLYRTVSDSTSRLADISRHLRDVQVVLRDRASGDHAEAFRAFASLALRNLAGATLDVSRIFEATAFPSDSAPQRAAIAESEVDAARRILQHVIAVLEESRGAFKSKLLGQLRHRLELFIADLPPPPAE